MSDRAICFTVSQLRAVADALGDTNEGLTGSEIGYLLTLCNIADPDPSLTKRHRLYNAFANDQNARRHRRRGCGFIRHSMKPERFVREPERFEPMRAMLNQALAFAGLSVDAAGTLASVEQVRTFAGSGASRPGVAGRPCYARRASRCPALHLLNWLRTIPSMLCSRPLKA